MMAFTVPAILFGSAGGVIVDRVPKKLIMVGSDVVRGLLTLLIPLLPREFSDSVNPNFCHFHSDAVFCTSRASSYSAVGKARRFNGSQCLI